jgi:hypothetical protein
MDVVRRGAIRRKPSNGESAMYFGTLVTQVKREPDVEPWKRDLYALNIATPSRWRAFWQAIARVFG